MSDIEASQLFHSVHATPSPPSSNPDDDDDDDSLDLASLIGRDDWDADDIDITNHGKKQKKLTLERRMQLFQSLATNVRISSVHKHTD